MLQHKQVLELPAPNSRNVEELWEWIKNTNPGSYPIGGKGSNAWGNLTDRLKPSKSLRQRVLQLLRSILFRPQKTQAKELDLVSMRGGQQLDGFTRWILYELVPFYHVWKHPPPETGHSDEEKHVDQNHGENKNESSVSFHIQNHLR